MTPRGEAILRDRLKQFREKFGRDPGPGDPVFFDPSKDEPTLFQNASLPHHRERTAYCNLLHAHL